MGVSTLVSATFSDSAGNQYADWDAFNAARAEYQCDTDWYGDDRNMRYKDSIDAAVTAYLAR